MNSETNRNLNREKTMSQTATEKMYQAISAAQDTDSPRKKYQAYWLAARYSLKSVVLNKAELHAELMANSDAAYAIYCA